ncbi:MAG: ABC transporter permease [Rikenellaceae bacterium]
MGRTFRKPQKWNIFRASLVKEMDVIGLQTVVIVAILSLFMGAAIVIQMTNNLENPLLPRYMIGYAGRESIVLEFSSTVLALVLSGKIGSNLASEIGTMRITEQIDALEIMGVNSANYLILPKIIAAVFFFPLLTATSMICGLVGGNVMVGLGGLIPISDYVYGLKFDFEPFYMVYSLIKSCVFGFLITSLSCFFGYYAKGTSLEVGRSSTRAVVIGSVMVLIFNILLTQLLLSK